MRMNCRKQLLTIYSRSETADRIIMTGCKDYKGLAGTIYDVNRYICNINHRNIYIMKFLIDTANLEQIREAYDLGVLLSLIHI